MKLISPFTYIDPAGGQWLAPAGSIIDGASIPKFAWSIIGGPFEGQYREASVVHDIACNLKQRPWELVHLTFYYAMRASGVDSTLAAIMYAAVYHFGPRWTYTRTVVGGDAQKTIQDVQNESDRRSQLDVIEETRQVCPFPPICTIQTTIKVIVTAAKPQLKVDDFWTLQQAISYKQARPPLSYEQPPPEVPDEMLLEQIRNYVPLEK